MSSNISSHRCIQVIAGVLGRAGEVGQKRRLEDAQQGNITYQPPHPPLQKTKDTADPENAEAENQLKKALQESHLGNTEEIDGKLDDARNHHGRRDGHRIRHSV